MPTYEQVIANLSERLTDTTKRTETYARWAQEAWEEIGKLRDERRELIRRVEELEAQVKKEAE